MAGRGFALWGRSPGLRAASRPAFGRAGRGRPAQTWRSAPQKVLLLVAVFCLAGCRQDMQDQPKYPPLRPSNFFDDGRSARQLIEDTVARGHLSDDIAFNTGKTPDGKELDVFPIPITKADILRGQERFNIYCTPCHSRLGNGEGMIVQRGYRHPPTYHQDRLRQAPPGHFFDVMTNGFGAMPDYAAQIPVRDRWCIVAYIRALQLSQDATINDVPPEVRSQIGQGGAQ